MERGSVIDAQIELEEQEKLEVERLLNEFHAQPWIIVRVSSKGIQPTFLSGNRAKC